MKLDSARETRDDGVWYSVGFGRFFGNNISLDLEYDEYEGTVSSSASFFDPDDDQWKLSTWGLMGRYHFGQRAFRPYLAAGLGPEAIAATADDCGGLKRTVGEHEPVDARRPANVQRRAGRIRIDPHAAGSLDQKLILTGGREEVRIGCGAIGPDECPAV